MKKNGKLEMADTKEVKTKAQRALEAKAKYQQLLEDGKNELLETANQTIKDLAELGFSYRLLSEEEYQSLTARPSVAHQDAPERTKQTRGPRKTDEEKQSAKYDAAKTCSWCKIHGHVNKAHNLAEGFKNQAFTDDELKKRGFWPPDGNKVDATA